MSTKKDSLGGLAQPWRFSQGGVIFNVRAIIVGAFQQLGALWKVLLYLYGPIALFFIVLDLISRSSDRITLSYFTRDIAALGHLPFFAGLVSQLGGLLWSATLTLCAFSLFILRKQNPDSTSARRLLLWAILLTAVLLFDDYFQLHEEIGPDYLHISEKVIELGYVVIGLIFLLANFGEIMSSEYLLLGLALVLFGGSAFLDGAHLDKFDQYSVFFSEQFQTFLEDGLKFVGIATWLTYFARYAYQKINARESDPAAIPRSLQN